jgi:Ca-activated chloride channel homolog
MRLSNILKSHCDSDLSRKKQSLTNSLLRRLLRHFIPRNDGLNISLSGILFFFSFSYQFTIAQSTRGLVNDGVDMYKEQKFADAEVNFKKGTEKNPESFEAKFNLGDAYYKQQRYDEAIKTFQSSFVNAKNDEEKAKIFHNIGNSLLKSKKIKESIGAYKEALKLNPNDQETKYNLSYALNMLNNPDQNQQQNDQNKDQNKDQQDQDQQNQDQQKQDEQQQNKDQQQQDQQQQSQEQKEQELTKQEAEKILNALKENEKDLQKQIRKIKGQRVKTEKDW